MDMASGATGPSSMTGWTVASSFPDAGAHNRYRLFGLEIASAVLLPELKAGNPAAPADLTIDYGAIPTTDADASQTLTIDDVARYWVRDGQTMIVEPVQGAAEANIRLFLLGTAMGIVIHQRGMMPLHANAIEIDGAAVAFMGPSGVGKSTLADWFTQQGFRMVADDVCAIRLVDGVPMVEPGIPRLRLWEDALAARGSSSDGLALSFSGDPDYRKFDLPLPIAAGTDAALPLAAVYLLDRGPALKLERLAGLAATRALFAHTYRGEYVREAGLPRIHMAICLAVASAAPCFHAKRRWSHADMGEDNRQLLGHARHQINAFGGEKGRRA